MNEENKEVKSVDKFEYFTPKKMTGISLTSKDLSLLIDRESLVPLISAIAKAYADCVRNTYGPGGYDTIIEDTTKCYTTKDGWTVARNLNLRLNSDLAALARMVLDVPANVNLKVGDCTTTAILAAHELNVRVQNTVNYLTDVENTPMYQIKKMLVEAVDMVCDEVTKYSHDITKDSEADQVLLIRDIAMVSTNWNSEFADMIANIYKRTKNMHILVEQGTGTKTTYEVIEGYDMPGFIQLPEYYVNDPIKQCYTVEEPAILMLDFNARGVKFADTLHMIGHVLKETGRDFIVMAPGFDNDFIKFMNRANQESLRTTGQTINVHPVVIHHLKNIDKSLYSDLSIILGAILVGNDNQDDFMNMINDVQNAIAEYTAASQRYKATMISKETMPDTNTDDITAEYKKNMEQMNGYIKSATEYVMHIAGSCKKATVSNKTAMFQIDRGMWTNHQVERVAELEKNVSGQLNAAIAKSESLSAILGDVSDLRTRLAKLSCMSGIIRVGGYGDGDIKAAKDALDDAIGACRATVNSGYSVGGGYAIPTACRRIVERMKMEGDTTRMNPFIQDIFDAFYACIRIAYNNYVGKDDQIEDDLPIIEDLFTLNATDTNPIIDAINEGVAYDLIAEKPMERLIEPTMASVETLRSCMRLVKLIATSKQYLYKKYTVSELIGANDLADGIVY